MQCALPQDWQYIIISIDSQRIYSASHQEDFAASGWVRR